MTDHYNTWRIFVKLENIKTGNIDPSNYFNFRSLSQKDNEPIDTKDLFGYPMSSLASRKGFWDINGNNNFTDSDVGIAETLVFSNYDEVYYIQEGYRDERSWIILAKTQGYYICLIASCDYTGFDCRGGGTFAYCSDWKTLWNMYVTAEIRNLVMFVYDYNTIADPGWRGYGSLHFDLEYVKTKIKAPIQPVLQ